MSASATGVFVRRPLRTVVEVVDAGGRTSTAAREPLPSTLSPDASEDAGLPILPLAPGRWLGLDVDAARVADFDDAGYVVVDVDGKWAVYEARATEARRVLSTAFDVEELLGDRGCATVTLFDGPAVVAQTGSDVVVVCVAASYAASFEAACSFGALPAPGGDS